ncbi:MAG: DUF599 domain-containing protein [Alphaproteobacteria bacterium]
MILPMSDWIAFGIYIFIIIGYSWLVETSPWARYTLSRAMATTRRAWFIAAANRELRMPDGQIMIMQQNGAAYFGSASLLGIGAGFTVLTAADGLGALAVFSDEGLALKALLLMSAYALAFFEFSWAFRLFSYNAIALGALGLVSEESTNASAKKAAALNVVAGQHFNRAIRLFLFAIPLILWLVSLWAMLGALLTLTLIMLRRQFFTNAQLDGLTLAWKIDQKG